MEQATTIGRVIDGRSQGIGGRSRRAFRGALLESTAIGALGILALTGAAHSGLQYL